MVSRIWWRPSENASYISVLSGNGHVTFQKPTFYGPGAASVALADFNGDGKLHVVSGGNRTLSVFLNNDDGTLGSASVLPIGYCPFHVPTGDMNGDGKQDIIAIANPGPKGKVATVSVFLGLGNGAFATDMLTATDVGASNAARLSVSVNYFSSY